MNFLALLQSPVVASVLLVGAGIAWKVVLPYFDKGEAAADTAIEKTPFFQKHPGYKNAIEYFIHRANIAVKSIGQTTVDALKASGGFNAAAAAKAKADALVIVKGMASKEALEQLAIEAGMSADQAHKTDDILSHVIESVISDQKAGASATTMTTDAVVAALQGATSGASAAIANAKATGDAKAAETVAAASVSPEAAVAAAG